MDINYHRHSRTPTRSVCQYKHQSLVIIIISTHMYFICDTRLQINSHKTNQTPKRNQNRAVFEMGHRKKTLDSH